MNFFYMLNRPVDSFGWAPFDLFGQPSSGLMLIPTSGHNQCKYTLSIIKNIMHIPVQIKAKRLCNMQSPHKAHRFQDYVNRYT